MATEPQYRVGEAVEKASGAKIKTSTIYKWWRDGVAGVRLEASFLGKNLYTSVEAVQRFRDAVDAKKRKTEGN